MKRPLWLCLLIVAAGAVIAEGGEMLPFYIGTYTSDDGSRGIYRATLDLETGSISEPVLAAEVAGPSYLELDSSGRFLYAVHEPGGKVSAFAVQPDGTLDRINTESTGGAGPCHLSLDQSGKYLLVANYSGGSLACLPIADDGSLKPASHVFENQGSGPNERRQTRPHLHFVTTDASNRFVYACDLGTDEVLVFRLDTEEGTLESAKPRSARVPAGGGPRHLVLDQKGKRLFVNNELTSSVTAFDRDPESGELTEQQTLSTLPGAKPVPGNTTAAIALHPTEPWLYVSNRGHDSIAVFEIANDAPLTLVEIASAEVSTPRGMAIDPTGRWLVAGGQQSNDITALALDPKTGKLTPGPNKISVGKPVCILFTEPAPE